MTGNVNQLYTHPIIVLWDSLQYVQWSFKFLPDKHTALTQTNNLCNDFARVPPKMSFASSRLWCPFKKCFFYFTMCWGLLPPTIIPNSCFFALVIFLDFRFELSMWQMSYTLIMPRITFILHRLTLNYGKDYILKISLKSTPFQQWADSNVLFKKPFNFLNVWKPLKDLFGLKYNIN